MPGLTRRRPSSVLMSRTPYCGTSKRSPSWFAKACRRMIAVLPAGIRFSIFIVSSASGPDEIKASGYALEIFGTHYALPDLGVLGANGLAHVRDFEYPIAAFDFPPSDYSPASEWEITIKLAGKLLSYTQAHTPFDVVAWHGKYAPYRYDLARFGHLTETRISLTRQHTAYSRRPVNGLV